MNDLNYKIERLIADLKKCKTENETLINTCLEMISTYQTKIDMYKKNIEEKENFIKTQITNLLDYNLNELKETKTELNYKTPSAKVYFKKEKEVIRLKPDYSENEIPERFIKVNRSVDWNGFKELLAIVDNEVINQQTGEIVKSVEIEKIPESELNIKLL